MTQNLPSAPALPETESQELQRLRLEVAALRAKSGLDEARLRHLAELGMVQAKLSHDLRNALTPALMIADRLSASPDAKVSRSGQMIVTALDQATTLITATLDFALDRPGAATLAPLAVAPVVTDRVAELSAAFPALHIENQVPDTVTVPADAALLARALGHLLRTAAKAQAKNITVAAALSETQLRITITDDGRPFRDAAVTNPLSPLSGAFRYGSTGLGLVIARELIEAHGGQLVLRAADDSALTTIEMVLPKGHEQHRL